MSDCILNENIIVLVIGVCGSIVVTFAAIRLQVRGSNPGQGINLDRDFCFMHTPKMVHVPVWQSPRIL